MRAILFSKTPNICKDRLGTNTEKVDKKAVFFLHLGVETAVVSLLKGIKQQGGVAVSFWFYDTPVVFIAVWLVPDDRCDSTSKLAGLVLVQRSQRKQHTLFKLNRYA